jgi:hypothetical protein
MTVGNPTATIKPGGAGGTFPLNARDAAAWCLGEGLAPLPVQFRGKAPWDATTGRKMEGWQDLTVTADNLDIYFPPKCRLNLGVRNGAASRNLADVDLDCVEALRAAPLLLPATGWIFGRATARRSHWEYLTDQAIQAAFEDFKDLEGKKLLELRGDGGQTVWPSSIHETTGEAVEWDTFTAPAQVTLADLRRAVALVAAAALLGRHWPRKGSRDDAAMALTGGLLRLGWSEDEVSAFVTAVAVVAGDEELKKRASKAELTAKKQAEGKPTTGRPKLAEALGERGEEVTRKVWPWLKRPAPTRVADVPEPPPWPEPPGAEAYHGLAGDVVRAIEPASEADPVAILVQTLIAFGNVIGRKAHFKVENDLHYTNEYAVLVGRTSKARKGVSWNQALRPLAPIDPEWDRDRVQGGLSSAEGLIWSVRDPIVKQERMKEGGSVWYEPVEADPGVADKRLLCFEPEFANVLKQTERAGNTLSVYLRQGWDRGTLKAMTKNSPATATGAHISIVGHITDEELQRYLTATEIANGFANRFLFVCAKRSKVLPEGGDPDLQALGDVQRRLKVAVAFARDVEEMRRDEEARALWREVYGPLSEGRPGLAGALLARAEAHVLRLSLLYALLDHSKVIGLDHLQAAMELWAYCERSVKFVFGDSLGDPVADELLRLLRGSPGGATRTEISNFLQHHASAGRIGQALGLLLQSRLARRKVEQTGGRPVERWYATDRKPE